MYQRTNTTIVFWIIFMGRANAHVDLLPYLQKDENAVDMPKDEAIRPDKQAPRKTVKKKKHKDIPAWRRTSEEGE